jgi:hypothetical protein
MTLDALRELAERLPDGAALTLPKAALLEALDHAEKVSGDAVTVDLGVDQLAELLSRSESTVRGWLEAGRFPGAYRLPGQRRAGAWRAPLASLEAFRESARLRGRSTAAGATALGVWRRHRPAP